MTEQRPNTGYRSQMKERIAELEQANRMVRDINNQKESQIVYLKGENVQAVTDVRCLLKQLQSALDMHGDWLLDEDANIVAEIRSRWKVGEDADHD